MDQLKLALEHKFWILAGLAILLPPIGWWAATDNLKTETTSRTKTIEGYDKRIPDPKGAPNEKWIDGAKQIDRELTVSVAQSQEHLFDHQTSEMTFPQVVQEALDQCKVRYHGDGGPTQGFLDAKNFFAHSYAEDWKNVVNLIRPFNMSTGEGLVLISDDPTGQEAMPITRHGEVAQWRQSLVFTSTQMWEVQEDIWFLRSLMQAIARVNQGATEIGNARIRKLNEVRLRGGDLTDLASRKSGKSTSNNPNGGATPQSGGMRVSFGGVRGSGSSQESSYKPPKAFDPDDIFGDDGGKSTQIDTRSKRDRDVNVFVTKRWADQNAKWRKRGFVLRLVMDEREIPKLLTSLSESAFPVEIRHVEHSVYDSMTAPLTSQAGTPRTSTEISELSQEQQAQQQALERRIAEGLRMALNSHYLADVIVAGTLTIYEEPAGTTSKSAAAAQTGSNQASAGSARTAGGKNEANATLAVGAPAKSAGVQSKPLSAAPATKIEPAKSGTPASTLRSGNKTSPGTPKAGASNPSGTGSRSAGK
jgi:hypothetical protein